MHPLSPFRLRGGSYRRAVAFAALLCLLAGLPRVVLALRPGLWVDEIFSLAMATGHSLEHPAADAVPALGDYFEPAAARTPATFRVYTEQDSAPADARRVVRAVFMSDTSPPLYYLLLSGWSRTAGTSDAALRLFSTLWALLSLPLLWLVGRRMGGARLAWIACLLFALSPPALYYSAEGRMYSLLWFLALLLAFTTLELATRGPGPGRLLLWSLAGAAGLLTHYFFAFVWLACGVWLATQREKVRFRWLLAAAAATLLLVLPWYLQVPESLARWRVTAGWLDQPLSLEQVFTAPLLLAWSLLSGFGVWGGSKPADGVAAAAYAVVIATALRRGLGPLFTGPRLLAWLWVAAAVLGPVAFDLLRGTNASLVARYALAGLPAAMLLAALGVLQLPRRWQPALVVLLVAAWTPGLGDVYRAPSRPWEPFPEIAAALDSWTTPGDLIIAHSIPSGVVAIARYLRSPVPIASWVPRLGQRRLPGAMAELTEGRCRVALVKVHDLGVPSPAQAWLNRHATLERRELRGGEILFYRLTPPGGRSATACAATRTPTPIVPETPRASAARSAG